MFPARWSPRAMSGEPVPETTLFRLFEAARWAPSSANAQPWRFLYGVQGTPQFQPLFALLDDGNQAWCQRAGALVLVLSRTLFNRGTPNRHHAYDTGAAWMSIALQGHALGLVTHCMAGFDPVKGRAALGVPPDFELQTIVAIGHPGDVNLLSEKNRPRETPNERRPVAESAHAGAFPDAFKVTKT